MSSEETRYAVIIGINDYADNPLDFCVNDANGIKEALINNCRFYEKNIFMITSDSENSSKDIVGKYMEVLRKIKDVFIEEQDSILFYFAGHGSCEENQSMVWMQESSYPIYGIFTDISSLRPKIQMYIIDSCHSGNKVLTRTKEDELKQYIRNAKGAMFLYACQNNENAGELGSLEHGLLTYEVLEAINNKSIYDEGVLTFNRIIDYVQKETPKKSKFNQIPVIENNITGFYPFAIDEETVKTKLVEEDKEDENEGENQERFLDNINNIRNSLMDKVVNKLNHVLESIEFDDYKITSLDNLDNLDNLDFEYEGVETLKKDIIEYIEKEKLEPLKNLIYSKEVKKESFNMPYAKFFNVMDSSNNVPKKIIKYIINFDDSRLNCNIKMCISNDIKKVSLGFGYISYQAKWELLY